MVWIVAEGIANDQFCGRMVWIVAEGIVKDQLCVIMVWIVAEYNSYGLGCGRRNSYGQLCVSMVRVAAVDSH
jgi:hypothetical protein